MSGTAPNLGQWTVKVCEAIGSTGNVYFWSPDFAMGVVEVHVMEGKHTTCTVHTEDKPVQDFRMRVMEKLKIDVNRNSTDLKVKLWSYDMETGDQAVVAQGGIKLQKLRIALPVEKYFVLFLDSKERGGYIKLEIKEADPAESDGCHSDVDSEIFGKENIEGMVSLVGVEDTPAPASPELCVTTSIPDFDSIPETWNYELPKQTETGVFLDYEEAGPSHIPRSSLESDFVSERTTAKSSGESRDISGENQGRIVLEGNEKIEQPMDQVAELQAHGIIIYKSSPPYEREEELDFELDDQKMHGTQEEQSPHAVAVSDPDSRSNHQHRVGAGTWIGLLAASLAGIGGIVVKHLVLGNGDLPEDESGSDDDL